MDSDQYLLFRCFIHPASSQYNVFDRECTKEDRFRQVVEQLYVQNKTVFQYWSNKHFVYSSQEYKDRLYLFKYAKEIIRKKKVEGDKNIEVVEDSELKTVSIILDVEWQILLIQKDSREFSRIDGVRNALQSYLTSKMRHWGYNIKITEIPEKIKFWEFVESHHNFNTLSLVFNAPNILFGNNDMRDALKILKEEFNIDECSFTLKSKENNLKITDKIRAYVDYIADVGGKYLIVARDEGEKAVLKSQDAIRKWNVGGIGSERDANLLIEKVDEYHKKGGG